MIEGWNGDDYLIFFAEGERAAAENRYAFSALLPGFKLIGLRGWDDFIVQDKTGSTYCIPTVPVDLQYLSPFAVPATEGLSPDPRFTGKIKWYVKPIVFGGDPAVSTNLIWVNHEEHGHIVKWWNDLYRSLRKTTHEN
ncbi:MAG: hypothetical protein JWO71_4033 [Candidatus Acidoferrum typicum]|nr:hypothetical protein [Candidatus Acidoferrum typicum]